MEIREDFKEWLGLLNAHGVEYVVVGSYALAFHGAPRYTGDLDILVRPTPENAERLMAALEEFGFGAAGLSVEDFSEPERIVQLGYPPIRIDLLTSLTGLEWDEIWRGRIEGEHDGVPAKFIGRQELIRNKRATGRAKDLADIEAMGEDPWS